MIDHCEAKRFIDAIPWPAGTKPLLKMAHDPAQNAHAVSLYRWGKRFPGQVAVQGPTPEGALRRALERYVTEYSVQVELGGLDLDRLLN